MRATLLFSLRILLTATLTFHNIVLAEEAAAPQTSATSAAEQTTSDNHPTQQKLPVEVVDAIINTTQKLLSKLQTSLAIISSVVNDGQISTITDEKETLRRIKDVSSFVQSIQHAPFVGADIRVASVLIDIVEFTTKYLQDALAQGLKNMPAFDPTVIVTEQKTRSAQQQPLNFDAKIKSLEKAIEKLSRSVDSVGLTRWNKICRKIDKYVVTPWGKHHITRRGLLAGSLGAISTYAWWHFKNESFNQHAPEWLRSLFGPLPDQINIRANTVGNYDQLGPIGRLECFVSNINHGYIPIFAGLLWLARVTGQQELTSSTADNIKKKITELANRWKGGAYLKESLKAADTVEEVFFDDLIGLDNVKREFRRIVDYLRNPESFDRIGAAPPKGILLIGGPRTGKSFSVKALYTEISHMLKQTQQQDKTQFSFITVNSAKIDLCGGISTILEAVQEKAPCVVFIDEIDLLDLQRKGKNQILEELLIGLSGIFDKVDPKNQIIIIGATNNPQHMDKALRQAGRFSLELYFNYPTFEERKQHLQRKFDKLSLNPAYFDIDHLAHITQGASLESLNLVFGSAILRAHITGQGITQEHLEFAIYELIHRALIDDDAAISEQESAILAAHFASHALALCLLNGELQLSMATICPVMTQVKEKLMGLELWSSTHGNNEEQDAHLAHGAVFAYHQHDSLNINSYTEKLNLIRFHLAGIVGEELLLGSCGFSCHKNDMEHALNVAQSITFEGMAPDKLPKREQRIRFDRAMELVSTCKQAIRDILSKHTDILQACAVVLQKQRHLMPYDIAAIGLHLLQEKKKHEQEMTNKQPADDVSNVPEPINQCDALSVPAA